MGWGSKKNTLIKFLLFFSDFIAKMNTKALEWGLQLLKKIIEGLGGRIWLESVYGQGSTFYFTIPKSGK